MSWYDFNDLRSHNCMMSFVLSARGGGKTYGAKMLGIKNWIKRGEQFVYVRRRETEFDTVKEFFNDIIENDEFPDYEFKIIGRKGYIRKKHPDSVKQSYEDVDGEFELNDDCMEPEDNPNKWETLCHFIALSISRNYKSTPFPKVMLIFYDEIIIDTTSGQSYLKNEERILLELMSTIIRKRTGVKFIGMANNISLVNPHFTYWKINVHPHKRFTKHPTKSIVVELWENNDFVEEMESTEFGQLITGTEYGDYAINNNTLIDNHSFIVKRPTNIEYIIGFIIQGKQLHMWEDKDTRAYYVDNTSNGENSRVYSITDIDHNPSISSIKALKGRPIVMSIKYMKSNNDIYYNNITTQSLFNDVLKYI